MNPYKDIINIKSKNNTLAQISMQKALLKLMETKKKENISVRMLCNKAEVARSTFYTYYQNIDDILEDIENQIIEHLLIINQKFTKKGLNKKEEISFSIETYQYIKSNKQTFYTILVVNPDYRFIEKWKQGIKYHFWERLYTKKETPNSEIILEMIATVVISTYSYCLKNEIEIEADGMYSMLSKILNLLDYRE